MVSVYDEENGYWYETAPAVQITYPQNPCKTCRLQMPEKSSEKGKTYCLWHGKNVDPEMDTCSDHKTWKCGKTCI